MESWRKTEGKTGMQKKSTENESSTLTQMPNNRSGAIPSNQIMRDKTLFQS